MRDGQKQVRRIFKDQLYTGESKYLINGTKTLKGHKLSTNNYINVQLLKFRNCSADVYHSNKTKLDIINNQFKQKYKPYDMIDDQQQFYDAIAEKRRKKTEQVKARLKMFEDNRGMLQLQQNINNHPNNNVFMKQKILPKQKNYRQYKPDYLNRTISFHQSQEKSQKDPLSSRHKFFCTTSNLGKHMNEYLNNVVLQRRTDIVVQEGELQPYRNCRTLQFKHPLQDSIKNKGGNKPISMNSYLRNMKRFKKIKQNIDKDNEKKMLSKLKNAVKCTIQIVNQKCNKYHTLTSSFFKNQNSINIDQKANDYKSKQSMTNRHFKHVATT